MAAAGVVLSGHNTQEPSAELVGVSDRSGGGGERPWPGPPMAPNPSVAQA